MGRQVFSFPLQISTISFRRICNQMLTYKENKGYKKYVFWSRLGLMHV